MRIRSNETDVGKNSSLKPALYTLCAQPIGNRQGVQNTNLKEPEKMFSLCKEYEESIESAGPFWRGRGLEFDTKTPLKRTLKINVCIDLNIII